MKHDIDTRRVNNPVRERLATARKRTLRSASARAARSVWSECQSRVIESRNFDDSLGLPGCVRGGSTDMYAVRRGHGATRAMCMEAGSGGSESGAAAHRGNYRALANFHHAVTRRWHYWLMRRSREGLNGASLWRTLGYFALSPPRIVHGHRPDQLQWSLPS